MAKNNKDSQKDTKKKKNNKVNNHNKNNKVAKKSTKVSSSNKKNKKDEKVKVEKKVQKKIEPKKETEKKVEPKKEIINNFEDNSDELLFDFVNNKEEEKPKKAIMFGVLDVLIVAVIVAIITSLIVGTTLNHRYKKMGCGYNQTYSSDQKLNEFIRIYSEVVENYYEEVDKDEMVDAAISGMLEYLKDKYSIYLDADDSDNLFDTLSGTYSGIGIAIYGANITEVYKDSPAEAAGIKSGDIISSVNGVAINNENADDISKIIGDNEDVALVVKRNDEELSYDLKVSKITLKVVSSQYFKYNNKGIAYIDIDSFSSTSVEQFAEELIELEKKGIDSIIIDLRDNGGGYISSAVGISSILLKEGSVIYSVEKKGQREEVIDKSEDSRDYKIVIIVNGNTASASEILALALKDNHEAVIVGTKSYGKGSVQTTKTLSDGTMLKYTSAKWYGPNGESIDEKGIIPDYEVKYQSGKDAPLEKALDLLK